ncbi:uncharacterized protein [Phyllobates terribilis]|uniref:uncharacterized protein n=1 Tax=Phyllobates terribilis TaxID=111132 RepID=UPI003CCB22A2
MATAASLRGFLFRSVPARTTESRVGKQQHMRVVAANAAGGGKPQKRAPPGVDTRIHWDNDDQGWVGNTAPDATANNQQSLLGDNFSDDWDFSGSHYQFLGVAANADLEEIKSAYRRLSKEYHPDTTTLPIKTASEKFMKLRQVYDILSDEESRCFYDWTLAQEAASRRAHKLNMQLQDPYAQDIEKYEPVPDTVDRLGGKNMDLSDQALTALTFDLVVIFFCICCLLYALFFKEY